MTKNRFTHKEDDWEILDNGEHLAYAHSDYQAEKICEVLNELHEKNKQLQKEIEDLNWELTEIQKSEDENYNITDGLW